MNNLVTEIYSVRCRQVIVRMHMSSHR